MQNNLLDRFIKEVIEANDLQFCGGGRLRWAGYPEPQAWPVPFPANNEQSLPIGWNTEPDIMQYYFGEIISDTKVETTDDPDYLRPQLDRS